jgi:hypothetical protein
VASSAMRGSGVVSRSHACRVAGWRRGEGQRRDESPHEEEFVGAASSWSLVESPSRGRPPR